MKKIDQTEMQRLKQGLKLEYLTFLRNSVHFDGKNTIYDKNWQYKLRQKAWGG